MKLALISKNLSSYILSFKSVIEKYKLEKSKRRCSLINVLTDIDGIVQLEVLVLGIKNQILIYQPDSIVFDDDLLSEFSPSDIRAITYLSFQKYINFEVSSLIIEGQYINSGKTVFKIRDAETKELRLIGARDLYENYELLNRLNKKDMIYL